MARQLLDPPFSQIWYLLLFAKTGNHPNQYFTFFTLIHILLLFSRSVMSDCFVTTWTVAPQAPLSMGFPRQEYWSGLPFPPPRASFKTLACSGSDKVLLNMTMISFQVKSKAKGMCWNVSIYLPGLV